MTWNDFFQFIIALSNVLLVYKTFSNNAVSYTHLDVYKRQATYWSRFGQAVILMLIQIGGMGVITVGLAIIRASGRKIGLWQRSTMPVCLLYTSRCV